MANGEYSINMFLSFLSIDLGAAMLAPSYSWLRECNCDQLVSSPRHPKASLYTPFRGSGGVSTQFVNWFSGAYSRTYRIFFASGPTRLASLVVLRATDAEPLIIALVYTTVHRAPLVWFSSIERLFAHTCSLLGDHGLDFRKMSECEIKHQYAPGTRVASSGLRVLPVWNYYKH